MTRPGLAVDDSLLRQCVHCGLCLEACPTYVEIGNEADSPRGRIHLIGALAAGEMSVDREAVRHLDLCLGCRACEGACPSGVAYGRILEHARVGLSGTRRPLLDRLRQRAVTSIFPYRRRLRVIAFVVALLQRMGLWSLIESLVPAARLMPRLTPSMQALRQDRRRMSAGDSSEDSALRVGLFEGCVSAVLQPRVRDACVRALERCAASIVSPVGQECCGALHLHVGDLERARDFARANIDAFDEDDLRTVIVDAAGCGAAIREYGELLRDDAVYAERAARLAARVRDVTDFVDEHLPADLRGSSGSVHRVTYHDACHLAHAQGVREQPRNLLRRIANLEVIPLAESEFCCGSAGSYNLTQPEMASRLSKRKVDNIERAKVECVAVANPGCAMQIEAELRRRGESTRVAHPIELLEEALR